MDGGELSRQEIADIFWVRTFWIRCLLQRCREMGSISALVGDRDPKPKLNEKQRARFKELIEKDPGMTWSELKKRLRVSCCLTTIHNVRKSLGFTYKNRYVPVNRTVTT